MQSGSDIFIGLGSNLDNPLWQLGRAVAALNADHDIEIVALSRWYRSEPWGGIPQPDYLNGVAQIATKLEPLPLLERLLEIEARLGRVRDGVRWSARVIDIDLLLHGAWQIEHPRLSLPHPEMATRPFVLYPLVDIAPDLILPDGRSLEQLLACCEKGGLEPIVMAPGVT